MTGDRLIKWSTVAIVVALAAIAALVSYNHTLALVEAHGETGTVALLVPSTVDGLIYASSIALLTSARQGARLPCWRTDCWLWNRCHPGRERGTWSAHRPTGAAVAAWPAVSLVGSYELLMVIIRNASQGVPPRAGGERDRASGEPPAPTGYAPALTAYRSSVAAEQPKARASSRHAMTLAADKQATSCQPWRTRQTGTRNHPTVRRLPGADRR